MKRSMFRRLLAVTLFCGFTLWALAETTQSVFQYKFTEGTVLDFETSATFTSPREKKQDEVHRHKITYTVLAAKDDTVDLFASAEMVAGQLKDAPFPFCTTLQMDREGKIAKQPKGASSFPLVFPGYSANIEIPAIVDAPDGGTIEYPDPITRLPLQAKVTKKLTEDTLSQKIEVDKNSKVLEGLPVKITYLRVENHFSVKEGLPRESFVHFSMVMPGGPNGGERELALEAESRLKEDRKLSAEALAKLKEDVAAGIAALQAAEKADGDTSAVLQAVDAYLAKFQNGSYAKMFSLFKQQMQREAEKQKIAESIKVGLPAPDFTAKTIDGKEIALKQLRGKVVVLDFWATWCGPCVAMVPHMKDFYEKYKDKDVVLIGVSADAKIEELKEFVEEKEISWPQIFDGDSETTGILYKYAVSKFPTIMVIDQQGVFRGVDVHSKLTDLVDQLLEKEKK